MRLEIFNGTKYLQVSFVEESRLGEASGKLSTNIFVKKSHDDRALSALCVTGNLVCLDFNCGFYVFTRNLGLRPLNDRGVVFRVWL